ncbi:dienelactone hydrolase family protein [uncultured Sphingomonas sp.]|uniref:dienelactone hydrolase family protein n=1 Tax=uncultured Sphingomonas sp. TaxID=158754 RepID=UPI0025F88063|nr:dienelactone hydrolase family protein [uncultured Sphingomonas sp.]
MDEQLKREAIALYDRFTHEGLERRDFMARMVVIAGSAAAAEALIGAIAASPAAAAVVPADDRRLRTATLTPYPRYSAYAAVPRAVPGRLPAVMVIHENRGLNEHIRDVTRRVALAGYFALAPDFLSPAGGTPANEDQARELIGKLDLAAAVAAGAGMIDSLKRRSNSNGHAGAVGFCWGGAFVNRLALAAGNRLDAGVVYYGTAPDPAEAAKVQTPLLIHHAGLDERVAQTLLPWAAALRTANKPVTLYTYKGANHAFNNDTSAERYSKPAADLAWQRTLAFFREQLR